MTKQTNKGGRPREIRDASSLTVLIPAALRRKLDKAAKSRGQSIGALCRQLLSGPLPKKGATK